MYYGQDTTQTFYTFDLPQPLPSSWIYYPTDEEPSTRYKFVSIEINYTLDLKKYNRFTYGLLDFFRDLGGLFITLYCIGKLFAIPFSSYFLQRTLMTAFFRFKDNT